MNKKELVQKIAEDHDTLTKKQLRKLYPLCLMKS